MTGFISDNLFGAGAIKGSTHKFFLQCQPDGCSSRLYNESIDNNNTITRAQLHFLISSHIHFFNGFCCVVDGAGSYLQTINYQ